MATVEELTKEKNALKQKVKELKGSGARESEISPVFESYQELSARIQKLKDAGLDREPTPSGGAGGASEAKGGDGGDYIARLQLEKDELKKKVKDAKNAGDDVEKIQTLYERYLLVKEWLASPEKIPSSERGDSPAAPVLSHSPSGVLGKVDPAQLLSEEELQKEKKNVKEEIKRAKGDGMSPDYIQPLYDRYLFLNNAIADYPAYKSKVEQGPSEPEPEPEPEAEATPAKPKSNVDFADAEEADVDAPVPAPAAAVPEPEVAQPVPAASPVPAPAEAGTFLAGAFGQPQTPLGGPDVTATTEQEIFGDAHAGNFDMSDSGDVDEEECVKNGILETEGGMVGKKWKKRYAALTAVEFVVRKEKSDSGAYKIQIDLRQGARALTRKNMPNQFEVLCGEHLATTHVIQADSPESGKLWARAIQNTVSDLENRLKKTLAFSDPPIGFTGKVYHLGWVEMAVVTADAKAPLVFDWRFLTLSDYCVNISSRVPTALSLGNGIGLTGELVCTLARPHLIDSDKFYLDVGGRSVDMSEPVCFVVRTGDQEQRDAWLMWLAGMVQQAIVLQTRDPFTFHCNLYSKDKKSDPGVTINRVSLVISRNSIALYPLLLEGAIAAIPDSTSTPIFHHSLSDLKEYRPTSDGSGIDLTFVGEEKNIDHTLVTRQWVSIVNTIYQVSMADHRMTRKRLHKRRLRLEADPYMREFVVY